jgi:hypothetical protein
LYKEHISEIQVYFTIIFYSLFLHGVSATDL